MFELQLNQDTLKRKKLLARICFVGLSLKVICVLIQLQGQKSSETWDVQFSIVHVQRSCARPFKL